MELRIRSLLSKETLQIELPPSPSPCLQNLKAAIAQRTSVSPEVVQIFLNQKDRIDATRPHDSLEALGIASGDLLFYRLNPSDYFDLKVVATEKKNFSVPSFVTKVLKKEYYPSISELGRNDYKLLIIAVHAVFLESGFVVFDRRTKSRLNGFYLPRGWASMKKDGLMTLEYTVPLLIRSSGLSGDMVTVVLRLFHPVRNEGCVGVRGSLIRYAKGTNYQNKSDCKVEHCCRLDPSHYARSMNFLWLNCDSMNTEGTSHDLDNISKQLHEGKILEFWRIVKDQVALPLLINLCEQTGLSSPPCFNVLPTELKLKVLELLPGVDIAKVACVSSELKFLYSDDELWKQKVAEEFNKSVNSWNNWKTTFGKLRKPQRPLLFLGHRRQILGPF